MLKTKMKIILFRSKTWNANEWGNGRIGRSLLFTLGDYLSSGYFEKKEDELLVFNQIYTINIDFPLIIPEAWAEVENKIEIDMLIDICEPNRIIGKAKLLEYGYHGIV